MTTDLYLAVNGIVASHRLSDGRLPANIPVFAWGASRDVSFFLLSVDDGEPFLPDLTDYQWKFIIDKDRSDKTEPPYRLTHDEIVSFPDRLTMTILPDTQELVTMMGGVDEMLLIGELIGQVEEQDVVVIQFPIKIRNRVEYKGSASAAKKYAYSREEIDTMFEDVAETIGVPKDIGDMTDDDGLFASKENAANKSQSLTELPAGVTADNAFPSVAAVKDGVDAKVEEAVGALELPNVEKIANKVQSMSSTDESEKDYPSVKASVQFMGNIKSELQTNIDKKIDRFAIRNNLSEPSADTVPTTEAVANRFNNFQFQYSEDGLTNWHNTHTPADKYMRQMTDGLTWTDPMRMTGYRTMFQYSRDGLAGSWYDEYDDEHDRYMRISVDEGATWGVALRMQGKDGEKGDDGILIILSACRDMGIVYGDGEIILNWTDPENVMLGDSALAVWQKTVLVRKVGSYPVDQNDGYIVAQTSIESDNRDYYRDNPVTDTAVSDGKEYYYRLFSQNTAGLWSSPDGNKYAAATAWSWSLLRVFVRLGLWDMIPPIGTVFGVAHEEFGTIWVRFAGKDMHLPTDTNLQHCMILECVDILFNTQLDAPELLYGLTWDETALADAEYYVLGDSGYDLLTEGVDYQVGDVDASYDGRTYPIAQWYVKNDTNRANYGCNRYSQSNIDQWLNADYPLNQDTFVKKNPWDALSTSLSRNGLLYEINPDFKASLLPVNIITNKANVDGGGQETISRSVFLLSTTELRGAGSEGVQLNYYVGVGNADMIKTLNGNAANWWLRSPHVNAANYVYVVTAIGSSNSHIAYNAYGVSPAFAFG